MPLENGKLNRDFKFDNFVEAFGFISGNTRRSMPPISGLLTTIMYLFPWLGRLVLPLMIRKGRNVKRKLKAQMHQMEEEQGG